MDAQETFSQTNNTTCDNWKFFPKISTRSFSAQGSDLSYFFYKGKCQNVLIHTFILQQMRWIDLWEEMYVWLVIKLNRILMLIWILRIKVSIRHLCKILMILLDFKENISFNFPNLPNEQNKKCFPKFKNSNV